ncbi:hypothetical protein E4U43_001423 [Claviceps pusilla]|uniref:Uncharacterized protein n=1 Tax=Claviceps pusilla TaxID=123648 RepID=A0A9P7SZA0_9HYPO|nr:hypothetical protein E4U43_001423 [Claviceps pusilla]
MVVPVSLFPVQRAVDDANSLALPASSRRGKSGAGHACIKVSSKPPGRFVGCAGAEEWTRWEMPWRNGRKYQSNKTKRKGGDKKYLVVILKTQRHQYLPFIHAQHGDTIYESTSTAAKDIVEGGGLSKILTQTLH